MLMMNELLVRMLVGIWPFFGFISHDCSYFGVPSEKCLGSELNCFKFSVLFTFRYALMLRCWDSDRALRPTFSDLTKQLLSSLELETVSSAP